MRNAKRIAFMTVSVIGTMFITGLMDSSMDGRIIGCVVAGCASLVFSEDIKP